MGVKRLEEWQLVVWGLFLAAFIGIGAVPFDSLHRQLRVSDQGRTNSADATYLATLELKDGSARVADTLRNRNLPPGSRIAVIYRFGTYQTVPAQLICLAAWSHGLRPFETAADVPDAADRVRNGGATAAFWLDGTPPAWFAAPEVLGSQLSFSRLPAR